MAWVVDTCVVIDVAEADPDFGERSARCLCANLAQGLVVCPVTIVELGPVFGGSLAAQRNFMKVCGIHDAQAWTLEDTEVAHAAWARQISARRQRRVAKRPVADIMIGAFAMRFDGLITRNPEDFRAVFPALRQLVPGESAVEPGT